MLTLPLSPPLHLPPSSLTQLHLNQSKKKYSVPVRRASSSRGERKAFMVALDLSAQGKMIIISACGVHMKGLCALPGPRLIIPPVTAAGLSYFRWRTCLFSESRQCARNDFTRRLVEAEKHVAALAPPIPPTPPVVRLNFEPAWPRVRW